MFLNEVQVDETWVVRGQPVADEYITPGKKNQDIRQVPETD